jgi:DNA modification methylase
MKRTSSEPLLFKNVAEDKSTPIKKPFEEMLPESIGPWQLNKVHAVDCLAALQRLPNGCLDVAVTSPPYWGQRGNEGIGQEEDPRDYVGNLVTILSEVMRCLKPSGILWLNVGDSYNTPINWRFEDYTYSSLGTDGTGLPSTNAAYTKNRGRRRAFLRHDVGWLAYGNLLAIPYRIVIALCDQGFLFRGEIIWEKSRPLPEGVCRRPHRRHEGIYVFAKEERHSFQVKPPVGSVWKLLQTPNKTPHCSTFPLDLPLRCIQATGLTKLGIVLDPFMGSGTTGKAALQLGHRFLGFELNSEMCHRANEYLIGREDYSA